MSSIEATLRAQPGVESVAPTGAKRFSTTVSSPYFTNDPYFNGFTATQNEAAQNLNLNTYHVGPYEESSNVPGQWDMHAIGLENAFAYSQSNNGSTVMKPLAIGSLSIKIAIIDTGEDSTHPELASKVAYQKCFITNPSGVASTSNFETDELGHGTDVSGIAAATTNNTFGFAGAGGNSVIYGYRVFPTPDDNCTNDTTNDNQCGSDTVDIASAIDDAVARGVNVISMSLGGNTCGTGSGFAANGDSDPTEGAAVAEAIAHNIVVVAAAGNSGGTGVASPGCDTGVIAVGATSLADGSANGSSVPGGSPTAPIEYVTSYTQTGSPNTYQSSASWGIVAPGGDPQSDTDEDDLHWIENIWTTTPYMSSPTDTSFEGECDNDYPSSTLSTVPDCRTLIAGTSMATPHVAGAAALILAVNPSYQSPSAMKQLLCSTADTLTVTTSTQGCGRLNVYRAMAKALSDPNLP
jgi:subtilisin family serine protease